MPYDITDAKEDIEVLENRFSELVKYLLDNGVIKQPKKEEQK